MCRTAITIQRCVSVAQKFENKTNSADNNRNMYSPEKFEVRDPEVLFPAMEKHPFATVTTVTDGAPFVNHLPITPTKSLDGRIRLLGHMSRRNPQWQHILAGSKVVIAFHGPHTFINPSWYKKHDVPTWNYIAIHSSGDAKVIEDLDGLLQILEKTTEHMIRTSKEKWDFAIPEDLQGQNLTRAIVGFEMFPSQLIGKFKLGQNRSVADRQGVIEGLQKRTDENSREIAKWMLEK